MDGVPLQQRIRLLGNKTKINRVAKVGGVILGRVPEVKVLFIFMYMCISGLNFSQLSLANL